MRITRVTPIAVLALALGTNAACEAQFRPSVYYPASNYSRVTITNQTRTSVVFAVQWRNRPRGETVMLEPGEKFRTQTTFAAGTNPPILEVRFSPWKWAPRVEVLARSGHVDPNTNNPGRIYDFDYNRTNQGRMLTLTPRSVWERPDRPLPWWERYNRGWR